MIKGVTSERSSISQTDCLLIKNTNSNANREGESEDSCFCQLLTSSLQ